MFGNKNVKKKDEIAFAKEKKVNENIIKIKKF